MTQAGGDRIHGAPGVILHGMLADQGSGSEHEQGVEQLLDAPDRSARFRT